MLSLVDRLAMRPPWRGLQAGVEGHAGGRGMESAMANRRVPSLRNSASPRNSLLRYIYIYVYIYICISLSSLASSAHVSDFDFWRTLGFTWSRGIGRETRKKIKIKKVMMALLTPDLLTCTLPRCVLVPALTAGRAASSHTRTYMLWSVILRLCQIIPSMFGYADHLWLAMLNNLRLAATQQDRRTLNDKRLLRWCRQR